MALLNLAVSGIGPLSSAAGDLLVPYFRRIRDALQWAKPLAKTISLPLSSSTGGGRFNYK